MPLKQELLEHMNLQFAKTAAEGDLVLRRDALIAKNQHMMIEVGTVNPREVLGIERPGKVEADDFGADGAGERVDIKML